MLAIELAKALEQTRDDLKARDGRRHSKRRVRWGVSSNGTESPVSR